MQRGKNEKERRMKYESQMEKMRIEAKKA